MFCSQCGKQHKEGERFCRKCGTAFQYGLSSPVKQNLPQTKSCYEVQTYTASKDPDELVGNGIGAVFVGDGFFMVAVILSATNSSISSLLWLLLLIPAFFFFGKGFADVLHAQQIRRRQKQSRLSNESQTAELPPPRGSVIDLIKEVYY
jgi:uncharacterized membrane protein YvbJ